MAASDNLREATVATTITEHPPLVTLINVFTVRPGKQRELVTLLGEATEQVMRHRQGFVSANIHASTDGGTVVNYAQWSTEADFHAMLADPTARDHMSRVEALVEHDDPKLYTVESVHSSGS
jgi:quinol monooxygenase YgiN